MQGLLYANISTYKLTEKLDSSAWSPPDVVVGSKIIPKLRLAQKIEGQVETVSRTVNSLRAAIGRPGEKPEAGTFQITLGDDPVDAGVNTTADIDYDATAAEIKAALDALSDPALADFLPAASVTEHVADSDAFKIVFEDETQQLSVSITDNALWPVSFANVEEIEFDEGYAYILSLRQAPSAEVTTFSTIVADGPSVTEKQAGGESGGVKVNEIQKLTIPPDFAGGSFQLKRGFKRTDVIGLPTTAEEIAEKLEAIADDGGTWTVSGAQNAVYIEFGGDMGGIDQDLLEVVVFDPPPSDLYFILDTNTANMRTLMRRANADGEIEAPLEITLELEDEQTGGLYHEHKWQVDVTFKLPVGDDAHNAAASLVWNQPPARFDVIAHSPDSLLIGHRTYREEIGDGVLTSFSLNHNLGPNITTFTADDTNDTITAVNHGLFNGDLVALTTTDTLPDPLAVGTDYYVINRTDDTLQLATTANGSAIDVTDTGTGTHSIQRNDGAGSGVHVTVYDADDSDRRVPDNEYEVNLDSENALTISGFASTPDTDQYVVFITLVGTPATYAAHTHTQAEISGLETRLTAIEAAIATLQTQAASAAPLSLTDPNAAEMQWPLPTIGTVIPLRSSRRFPFTFPASGELSEIETGNLRARSGSFVPAVHDTAAEALTVPLPAVAEAFADRVFENQTASAVDLPGLGGRRTVSLQPGEFAACNGVAWYPVFNYDEAAEDSWYPAFDFETDLQNREGTVVELFCDFVNSEQLALKRVYEARLALSLATLLANTKVSLQFVVEIGTIDEDSSPGTPGVNLDDVTWDVADPAVAQTIRVSGIPRTHELGVRVARDADDTITLDKLLYGKVVANNDAAPASANFAVRGRLIRFDIEDDVADPKGFLAIGSPNLPASQSSSTAASEIGVGKIG